MQGGHHLVMAIGDLIRDRRQEKNLTQAQLADELSASARDPGGAPGRDAVKRWETGKVIPGILWLTHLARVLDIPLERLQAEATLARVNRRSFLSLAALTASHGGLAAEVVASVAGRDPVPLAQVQTTHNTDIVIAALAGETSPVYPAWGGG